MNKFKLGYNFSGDLLPAIVTLNEKYAGKSIINEVFGSIRSHAWLAARPDFRLPDITLSELRHHVYELAHFDIVFNYTLNTINPGSRDEISMVKLDHVLRDLVYCGINRVTVANPLLIELIRELTGDHFEIEISTVAHIDAVTQIQYLHEKYKLKKVCAGIHKNRSFRFLENAAKYCNDHGIELELLANEFCANGGKGEEGGQPYTTHCAYRDSCYQLHATDKTAEDTKLFGGYPMHHCMASRDTDPVNWLRTRFIRPQDLSVYREVGITKFKISGRTGSLEYLEMVAEAYMSEDFKGNLLALWKPLETITNGVSELDHQHGAHIPCDKLDGFLDHWSKRKWFDCANELCGTGCVLCHDWYNEHLAGNNLIPVVQVEEPEVETEVATHYNLTRFDVV